MEPTSPIPHGGSSTGSRSRGSFFPQNQSADNEGAAKWSYDEVMTYINSVVNDFQNRSAKIEKELRESETVIGELKTELKSAKTEASNAAQDAKTKVIETLAIFATLFTFISVNFQIFSQKIPAKLVVGLILILAGLLCVFVLLVYLLVRREDTKNSTNIEGMKLPQVINTLKEKFLFLALNETSVFALFFLAITLVVVGVLFTTNSPAVNADSNGNVNGLLRLFVEK